MYELGVQGDPGESGLVSRGSQGLRSPSSRDAGLLEPLSGLKGVGPTEVGPCLPTAAPWEGAACADQDMPLVNLSSVLINRFLSSTRPPAELLSGLKHKGLWCHSSWEAWKRHPVVSP